MDGEEFYSYEDIPPQPHPNCKCYVEVLECPYEPEYSTDDEEEDENEPQSKKPHLKKVMPKKRKSFLPKFIFLKMLLMLRNIRRNMTSKNSMRLCSMPTML